LLAGCNKSSSDNEIAGEEAPMATERFCAADEVLQDQLKADPSLRERMDAIEEFTRRYKNSPQHETLVGDTIVIPVVYNVIYSKAIENISLAQLQSQIDVLNEDFKSKNLDYNPGNPYNNVEANGVTVNFVLETVNRKLSTKKSWSTNDDMKRTSRGGLDATSPTTKLNIWVVNKMVSQGRTILGYAQFPGGPAATDGIVLGYNFTGRVGTLSAPFNKGRTGTHEVGHWMNLRHIWGDATCGNDQVEDTPAHNTANYGCPSATHRSTCAGTPLEMTMNYMDYTDDACMYMFSAGQKIRMESIFAPGAIRASFR
jgi:flagellar basal body rod protein FlgC